MYFNQYISPFGKIFLSSDGKNLTNLYFEKQCNCNIKKNYIGKDIDLFKKVDRWLDLYFAGKNPDINFSIFYSGINFQMEIWKILKTIPYGKTVTYGYIADKIKKLFQKEKMSAQAVGGAVKKNPISIIVPCHRVIGKNESMVGYSGGIDLKINLLKLENAIKNI